jgi:hypothetical protein
MGVVTGTTNNIAASGLGLVLVGRTSSSPYQHWVAESL